MIEIDGYANPVGKSIRENSTKLRFNVTDIDEALATVKAYGITAQITRNDWGSTINIYNPDGYRVGIRDETSFKVQIVVL